MITTKERAALRRLANGLTPLFQIGKSGVTESVIATVDEALTARELIKLRVLETSPHTAREASDAICAAIGADGVQVVGRVLVLYRENPDLRAYAERI